MLANYLEVNEIVKEELCSTIGNSIGSCYLGKVNVWTNGLQRKVISMCSDTVPFLAYSKVSNASHALHVDTNSVQQLNDASSGVKVLKSIGNA